MPALRVHCLPHTSAKTDHLAQITDNHVLDCKTNDKQQTTNNARAGHMCVHAGRLAARSQPQPKLNIRLTLSTHHIQISTTALARLYANNSQTTSEIHVCSNHCSGVVGGAKGRVVPLVVVAEGEVEVEVVDEAVSRTVTSRLAG